MKTRNGILIGLAIIALMGLTLSGCKLDEGVGLSDGVGTKEGQVNYKTITFPADIKDIRWLKNGKPKIMVLEDGLKVFNEDGTIKNEEKLRNEPYKIGETIKLSENGSYYGKETSTMNEVGEFVYKDINGDKHFTRKMVLESYDISPNGEYLVFQDFIKGIISICDKNGGLIKQYDPKIEKQPENIFVKMSENSEYCLITIVEGKGGAYNSIVLLYKEKDRAIVVEKRENMQINAASISPDGHYFVIGGYKKENISSEQYRKSVVLLYKDGDLIWEKEGGPNSSVSSNGQFVVMMLPLASEKQFVVFSGAEEWAFGPTSASNLDIKWATFKFIEANQSLYLVVAFPLKDECDQVVIVNVKTKNIIYENKFPVGLKNNSLGYAHAGSLFATNIMIENGNIYIKGRDKIVVDKLNE